MSTTSSMSGRDPQTSSTGVAATAESAVGEATKQARTMLDEQKSLAAHRIEDIAQVLRRASEELDQQTPGAVAEYTRRAVQGLDSAADALRNKTIDGLLADAENFARREPALFLAGSMVAGFALARFLKSSAGRREQPTAMGRTGRDEQEQISGHSEFSGQRPAREVT